METSRSLYVTLAVICSLLVFGVHCSSGSGPSGFGEPQIDCQAALAALTSCCQGFDPAAWACDTSVFQSTETAGCGATTTTTTTTYPTLSEMESQCILGETCDVLASSGVCQRAIESGGAMTHVMTTQPPSSSGGCSSGGGGVFEYDASFYFGDGGFDGGFEGGFDAFGPDAGFDASDDAAGLDGTAPTDAAFPTDGMSASDSSTDAAKPFVPRSFGHHSSGQPTYSGSVCP